ncbi:uncharacterized protein LOC120253342 isoform X2 [Dioscorea cayenensis subsp. rotundata]|uniref:Uncharacterized protein LOC120253342 isoform X2 n=1 Tax=Dioscorea cayennensis subsp. rotundata TaxID=55577 RepID=A0AB40ARR2_DIOCR|nr:uncharacterized protein LOC120253342 isoform X2 [Dioscorea cayenensis subsp. rotundata]
MFDEAAYEMLPDAIGQTRLNASIGDEFASHILSRAAETLDALSNIQEIIRDVPITNTAHDEAEHGYVVIAATAKALMDRFSQFDLLLESYRICVVMDQRKVVYWNI